MILWRISNHADLEGRGGLVASGRWHTRGHPIVYLAESPSGALIEALVHLELDPADLPESYQLLKITVPSSVKVQKCSLSTLGEQWAAQPETTRRIGDEWLRRRTTALLRIPSAIAPETWNWLLNPAHPHARRIKIAAVGRHLWDPRLR